MRLDQLEKIDAEVVRDATLTVLESMPGKDNPGELTVMRLPQGGVDALTEALCAKFHQLFCAIRGAPPREIFGDQELFKQHMMALQTILVVSFAIGHTCGETVPNVGGIVH